MGGDKFHRGGREIGLNGTELAQAAGSGGLSQKSISRRVRAQTR